MPIMKTAVSTPPIHSTSFPETTIINAIDEWWAKETSFNSAHRDPFATKRQVGGTVFDVQPVMDSLRAVVVLVSLEEMLPFELPDTLIKLGGYDGLTELRNHLVPQIDALWKKHFRN